LRVRPLAQAATPRFASRTLARFVSSVTLATAIITCTDSPTVPRPSASEPQLGRLAIAPAFSAEASRAAEGLSDFDIGYDRVRVVLTRASRGDVVLDTTITFRQGSPELSLDLKVRIVAADPWFDALIEYRDPQTVLFSGTTRVLARGLNDRSAPASPLTLTYVGPGAGAVRVELTPQTALQPATKPLNLSASVFDAGGRRIAAPLAWSVSDPSLANITRSGETLTLTPTGRPGLLTVTALRGCSPSPRARQPV
jgi:hypothetical protein